MTVGAPAACARRLSSATRWAGVPTQWWPAYLASPLAGPADWRRFHRTMRLVADRASSQPLAVCSTLPPLDRMPSKSVTAGEAGLEGTGGV